MVRGAGAASVPSLPAHSVTPDFLHVFCLLPNATETRKQEDPWRSGTRAHILSTGNTQEKRGHTHAPYWTKGQLTTKQTDQKLTSFGVDFI